MKKTNVLLLFFLVLLVGLIDCEAAHPSNSKISRTLAYRNVLPPSLVERLVEEAKIIADYESTFESLKNYKKYTRWFPKGERPKTAIEEAISRLESVARPGRSGRGYAGAEWWVQRVSGVGGKIGFHVDKDESIASNKHYLVHPEFSSIFYLTNSGGCTLILDQHSPRGSGYEPEDPLEGELVCPEKNKYAIFNGTLLHGVLAGKPEHADASERERITFLVNWWPQKPEEPNCILLPHKEVPRLTYLTKKMLEELRAKLAEEEAALEASKKRKRVSMGVLNMDPNSGMGVVPTEPFTFELPGGSSKTLPFPKFFDKGQSYTLVWKHHGPKLHGDL